MSGPAPFPELVSPLATPYRLEGKGEDAVVLVHGFTGLPSHFRPLAERLHSGGFTVNVPLLAGHGSDPEHLATTTAEDWEQSVRWAVQAVSGHRRVHVVGLSMGGLLGIRVAATEAVTSVATINSPILVRDRRIHLARVAHHWQPTVEWDDAAEADLDPATESLRAPGTGFHTVSAAELATVIRRAYGTARRMRRPALVIQSKVDRTVEPVSGRLLARALGPATRLVWLEESAHNALLDRERELVGDLVLEHVDGARR